MKLLKYLGVAAFAVPSLQAEVIYTNDFENDTAGNQPSMDKATPSTNDASRGFYIVDDTTSVVNPLLSIEEANNKSLYLYDFGCEDKIGVQASFLINEDSSDLTDARIDFDFQSIPLDDVFARPEPGSIGDDLPKVLSDDGFNVGVTRAEFISGVNSSKNRPFNLSFRNDGSIYIEHNDGALEGEGLIGAYDTTEGAWNRMTMLINSHDTDSISYDYENALSEIESLTIGPNTYVFYLNGIFFYEGVFYDNQKESDPVGNFHSSNADIGAMGMYQDTNSYGTFVIDNISVETLFDSPVPVINAITEDFVIVTGDTAILEVDASGEEPLTYQWYEGVSGDISNPIVGATEATVEIENIVEASQFWVRVTNDADSADSETISITMYVAKEMWVDNTEDLNSVLSAALPGDVIVMENGDWVDFNIVIDVDGTEMNNITLRAEETGQVILQGNSTLNIGGDHVTVQGLTFYGTYTGSDDQVIEFRSGSKHANHSRLTECKIIAYNGTDALYQDSSDRISWVNLYGTYNRVDHCLLTGMTKQGLMIIGWITGEHFHQIDNNTFSNRSNNTSDTNGWEIIRLGTSDSSMFDAQITVENNRFEKCNGEIEIISNKSNKNVYKGNLFYLSEGALTMRHGEDCLIDGNIFIGDNDQCGGVRIIDSGHVVINNYFYNIGDRHDAVISVEAGISEDQNPPLNSYFPVDDITIAYNTIVDCDADPILMGRDLGDPYDDGAYTRNAVPTNVVIANNLAYKSSNSSYNVVDGTIDETTTLAANMYWNYSVVSELGMVNADPDLYQDEDNEAIYRPSTDSPVIDAAEGDAPDYDIDGESRTAGSADIGADEVMLPVEMPEGFFNAEDIIYDDANGTLTVDWLGSVYTSYFPWIYHYKQGWWYASGDGGTSEYYFYDEDLSTWFYTTDSVYPWVYAYPVGDTTYNWIYFYQAEDSDVDNRLYWSDDNQAWESVN